MIKSKIESKSSNKFPRLMVEGSSNLVVLFLDEKSGVVVHGYGAWGVGDYATDWEPSCFTDFYGKIILEG